MQLGRLVITLPDGHLFTIGRGEGSDVARIRITDSAFFKRCFLYGDIGFGESYVEGLWETDDITQVIKWFLLNISQAPTVSGSSSKNYLLNGLKFVNKIFHLKKANTISGSRQNISAHYDLSNAFFSLFLDKSMTYSSAYFREEGMSLERAQFAKYDRLCRQLHLKPTDQVLEIGSGWGSNAVYMAKNYGCSVTTVTISEEQFKWATAKVEQENLQDKVKVLFQDYRNIEGTYDKIVSIEMIEAVGAKFLEAYFKKCTTLLKKDGILALQTITCPDSRFNNLRRGVDWIQKYIFPGSLLPSVGAINNAVNKSSDLTLVDLKDMGTDYAQTLRVWRQQFNENLSSVKKMGFNNYFIRKWNYYFCYCEAAFATRNINVMQMVYTRPNNSSR